MAKVHKTIADARKHLGDSVAQIPQRYAAGTAKADWEGPSTSDESEANYMQGISESNARDGRRSGVRSAGNAKYKKGCGEKGASVIGARITASLGEYERKFSPIHSAMCAASDAAPPRTRDFRTNVVNRLFPVVEAAKSAAGKT